MDVQNYLKTEKSRLAEQCRAVRDVRVFDFGFVPDQPLVRDETATVLDALVRYELTGVPTHYLVLGSRGSGKTLTMKYLLRELPKQTALTIKYANCRNHSTSHRLLAHLLDRPHSGLSLGDLYDRFMAAHAEDRLVLILDEVDLMSPKDRRREILYLLSRSERPVMLVLLSNNHRVVDQLDAATRSSLQLVPLLFRGYTAAQVQTILLERARSGLHAWDDGDLAEIAARTVRLTHADARVAIKTLFYRVTRPDRDVAAAFDEARRDIVVDVIHDLTDPLLLILSSVERCASRLAKDVYRHYVQDSQRHGHTPFSYVHYYANLAFLQSCGLVALASTKVGRTYTNRIEPTFEPGIVDPLYRARFDETTPHGPVQTHPNRNT